MLIRTLAIVTACATNLLAQCPGWSPMGAGLPIPSGLDYVSALAVRPPQNPGEPEQTFATVSLLPSDTPAAGRVFRFDGASWTQIGSANGRLHALLVRPWGEVVVGGQFTSIDGAPFGGLARWNGGNAWGPLPQINTSGSVRALAQYPWGDIVAAGSFTSCGGVPVANIVRINNETPVRMGNLSAGLTGGSAPTVHSVAVLPDFTVVAGGLFTQADGQPVSNIARYSIATNTWSPLNGPGSGVNGPVFALVALPDGGFVVGGEFDAQTGGPESPNVCLWTGDHWDAMGVGLPSRVTELALTPAGKVIAVTEENPDRIYEWDGDVWRQVGEPAGYVFTLATTPGGDVIAGGAFSAVNQTPAANVARLRLALPETITPDWTGGVSQPFLASRTGQGDGFGYYEGGLELLLAAPDGAWRWNGQTRDPVAFLPAGKRITAAAATPDGSFILAGNFTGLRNWYSSAPDASFLASYDAAGQLSRIGPPGSGPASEPDAVAAAPGAVYAAVFSPVTFTSTVHAFNAGSWSTLPPVAGRIRAMAVTSNGLLVVGGSLLDAAGQPSPGLRRWTGASWQPYAVTPVTFDDSTMTTTTALTAAGPGVIAGGTFAGPLYAGDAVARFDGSIWTIVATASGQPGAVALMPNGDTAWTQGAAVRRMPTAPASVSVTPQVVRTVECGPFQMQGSPGEQLALTATASGPPGAMLIYQWRINGQPITTAQNEYAHSRTLRLPVHRPPTEQYTCSVTYGCSSAVTGPATAGTPAPRWVQVTAAPAGTPAARSEFGIAFDRSLGRTVIAAGGDAQGQLGDTWTFDGISWGRAAGADVSPRSAPAMAFTPSGTVLFGGYGAGTQTLVFDGRAWTDISADAGTPPQAAFWSAFAADEFGSSLFFGGEDYSSTPRAEAWQFGGFFTSGWSPVTAAPAPSARGRAALAPHFANRILEYVLFGGRVGAGGAVFGDTWVFDGAWRQVTGPAPEPRYGHAACYDPIRNSVLLFGGFNAAGAPLDDLWEFTGSEWRSVPLPVGPPARALHGMAFDSVRNAVVLFGGVGADGQRRSDTWMLLYGPRITQQPVGATACIGQGATLHAAADAAGLGGTLSYQWVHDGAPIDPSQNPSAQTPTLTLSPFTADDAGEYACVVTASFTDAAGPACLSASTATARLAAPAADVGSQGGVAGPDGQFDNNDFIVFINGFFAQEDFADLGVQGGVPGSDGFFDNNDFIAFISLFFAGC